MEGSDMDRSALSGGAGTGGAIDGTLPGVVVVGALAVVAGSVQASVAAGNALSGVPVRPYPACGELLHAEKA
jgi:hypothetical protein